MPGDVSRREYLRAEGDGNSLIVSLYPIEMLAVCRRYLTTTELLSGVDIRVPRLLACDCDLGIMALEDVGRHTLYDLDDLDETIIADFFRHAVDKIARIQSLPAKTVAELNPPLDSDLLKHELHKTWVSFLAPRGIEVSNGFGEALQGCLNTLCDHLGGEILVPCHRDYMVRNLIPMGAHPSLVVIDHQDLRLGPRYYDLASMLNDSLFPSPELEEEILQVLLGKQPGARVQYHRAAAQRTLKAIGTYETFAQRGFERHRRLISPTLDRALRHLGEVPESHGLVGGLKRRLGQEIC